MTSITLPNAHKGLTIRSKVFLSAIILLAFLLFANGLNNYYAEKEEGQYQSWALNDPLDKSNPINLYSYYNLSYTNDLIIEDTTLQYINNFFRSNVENESMLYLYGYEKDNKTFIEDVKFKIEGILSSNHSNVRFVLDNTSIGVIHNHPNPEHNCMLSDLDLDIKLVYNQTVMLWCVDKILWYDGSFHLLNITKEVK